MSTIQTRQEGRFFYITLNRTEKKNAIDAETYTLLANTLNSINHDPNVTFTVFTGNGDFFSSGSDFDFSRLKEDSTAISSTLDPPYYNFVSQLIEHSKILIALVNGPAIGIAVTMLALFDLVLASDKAYFMTPFTQLGLAVEATSSYSFVQNFGRLNASRLLLFSERVTAQEAKQIGLISHVYPHENFKQNVQKHLDQLKNLAPESMLQCKARMINENVRKELWLSHIEEKKLLATRWQSRELFEFMSKKFKKSAKI